MKRIFLALGVLVLLVLAAAAPALAADPKDVPSNHWAYQAVKKLVSQGYLGLYPDDTFRGDQPVDRYTLAVVVARLVENAVYGKITLPKDDAELLRSLTKEFREELVTISQRVKTLEEALARYEKDQTAMADEMAVWHDETNKLQERVDKLEKQVRTWRWVSIVVSVAAALLL